ncbi:MULTISPECIES: Com family DNA-binding transcriptional regulator [Acinetobacter]|uniref:Com family DNA-binding transcriptional regulator n=3 Tax=Acinetobacter TaxID=469 RepID=A0AB37CSC7_ACINO|nr:MULTISPECIES: Com family DNA-binding transcriptional regulator [Acinetobacter]EXH09690.1 mu-like prophage Com family protein [Acinetobacter sp. 1245593]MCU4357381.1 Com family DNA-binding transcriptional regulator [Acinetobacter ursingii]MDU6099477.1 Com family DNA-binding transcriptional regulator [Acinetobacter sp.]RSB94385.1 Com family DNA-binding transcriptional regulator [Acinetobacter sp. FDAARGOS_541]ASO72533.1 Com family DNA-binding transcriptional regulator [Acinetobacter baumannii
MQNLKCQCCFKLLARTDGFNQIEIKCPRCKTLNTFQSTLSALPECPEHQTPGKIHDTKPLTTIQS